MKSLLLQLYDGEVFPAEQHTQNRKIPKATLGTLQTL